MHSNGPLIIERRGRNAYKRGPTTEIFIEPGVNYGINIIEPYPQALDPNKRFYIETYTNKPYVQDFLNKKFYGFKPFKNYGFESYKENIAKSRFQIFKSRFADFQSELLYFLQQAQFNPNSFFANRGEGLDCFFSFFAGNLRSFLLI